MLNNRKIARLSLGIILVLIFASVGVGQSRNDNWLQSASSLIIGESNRHDVENVFSITRVAQVNQFPDNEIIYYETKVGRLEATYSAGPCTGENGTGYRLERGILISLSFWPSKAMKIRKRDLHLEGYEIRPEDDNPNWNYFSVDSGKLFVYYRNSFLNGISFGLSSTQIRKLTCN